MIATAEGRHIANFRFLLPNFVNHSVNFVQSDGKPILCDKSSGSWLVAGIASEHSLVLVLDFDAEASAKQAIHQAMPGRE